MNTRHIDGITVVSVNAGERLGRVIDLSLDADGRQVTALVVQSGGGGMLAVEPPELWWLPAEGVRAIGPDALTVDDAVSLREFPPEADSVQVSQILKRQVITESGVAVGPVAALEIDERRMTITALEISTGFLKSNRMVSAEHLISVGPELIVVQDAVSAPETDKDTIDAEPMDADAGIGDDRESSPGATA